MAILEIPDRTFARLKADAEARRVPVEAYLESIVFALPQTNGPVPRAPDFSLFIADAVQWGKDNLPPGYEADDSRESIYADRD